MPEEFREVQTGEREAPAWLSFMSAAGDEEPHAVKFGFFGHGRHTNDAIPVCQRHSDIISPGCSQDNGMPDSVIADSTSITCPAWLHYRAVEWGSSLPAIPVYFFVGVDRGPGSHPIWQPGPRIYDTLLTAGLAASGVTAVDVQRKCPPKWSGKMSVGLVLTYHWAVRLAV